MPKYSLGYNQDPVFIKLIDPLKEYLSEIYFPAPYSIMSSGRAVNHESDYEKNIERIIKICKKLIK